MKKRNIREFGKAFEALKAPPSDSQGSMGELVIQDAEFSGEFFKGQTWRNIRFVNCDFLGAYEIGLDRLQNCRFEGCRFAGIIGWGVAENVTFVDCRSAGESNITADEGSKGIRFEKCSFQGADEDRNRWGTFGSYGQAEYVDCNLKWFSVFGFESLVVRRCTFIDAGIRTDSPANSGPGFLRAKVSVQQSRLQGVFDARACNLESLTLHDVTLDWLDMSNASVKGDILMERVRGGAMQIAINEGAQSFSLKNSQILGDGDDVCGVYAGAFKSVLVEDTVFGGGVDKKVVIGGGFEPDNKKPQPVMTESLVFRRCKIPSLRSGRLNAAKVIFENNEIGSLKVDQCRVGTLEMTGNTIARTVDFSDTQVQESKVQPLAAGQAKLEGSNVKVGSPR